MTVSDVRLDPKQWADPWWRLCNLYRAVTDAGEEFKFYPNDSQERLYNNRWYLNLILKARQQGFSTFIDLILLDQALFNANKTCGIIADTRENATKLFRNKVKYPYDRLPLGLRIARETESENTSELIFNNGSSLSVGTSMRGGTVQLLHISEYGKISAKFPDKAKEIKTGALNAVALGQYVFVESTAEGKGGEFYEMTMTAQKAHEMVKAGTAKLTAMDFRFHFFAWWESPKYTLNPEGVAISTEMRAYFAELDVKHGIKLTPGQQAALEAITPPSADRESLLASQAAIGRLFLNEAKPIAARMGIVWPEAFDAAPRQHLKADLSLAI